MDEISENIFDEELNKLLQAESQRLQFLEDIQWTDQAQRERIHLCGELELEDHLHQECCARSCREIEDFKRRCCEEENTEKNNEDWKNFLRSMIRNHEQCVY